MEVNIMSSNLKGNNLLEEAWRAQQKGNFGVAVEKYLKQIAIDPANSHAVSNVTVILINQGKLDQTEKVIMDFLERTKGDVISYNHLSIVYMRTGRSAQAAKLLEHALTLDPFNIETHLNLVNVHANLKDHNLSIHYALEAVKIDPTSSKVFNNLGTALNNMALFNEAKVAFLTAYELDKDNLESILNLATIQVMDGENDEAIGIYEKTLRNLPKKLKAQEGVIKFLLSFEYLKKGKLKIGYEYYDCGFHPNIPSMNARSPARKFPKPIWDGRLIKGKKLLLWREQGLGDEMLFLASMPDIIKFHDDIILEVDHRLVDTIQRSFPNIKVRSQLFVPAPLFEAVYTDYDYHLPIGSLMRYFRKSINDYSRSGPYIVVDPVKKTKFAERLAPFKGKLLIGICWRSGSIDALRAMSYVGILKWGQLFSIKDVVWVNLQYGECEEECLEAEKEFGIEIVRWPDLDLKDDLDDVFALMSELDYVVTVATAVQTMAAAAGVKTLLITPTGAWHRFNLDYDPWFPNLHTFIADYKSLDEAIPRVKNYILSNTDHSKS